MLISLISLQVLQATLRGVLIEFGLVTNLFTDTVYSIMIHQLPKGREMGEYRNRLLCQPSSLSNAYLSM